jgi:hypothetical protein
LSRKIAERSIFLGNGAFDLADGFRPLMGVFRAAKPMYFKASIVGHHILKAKMRQPAELQ